jgi:rod shape-determining protein MreC
MFVLRRWWDRNALKVGVAALVLAGAWGVRQTQGAFVAEIYQVLSRPFQGAPQSELSNNDPAVQILRQRIVELESQNRQLQKVLGYAGKPLSKGILAPVIGRGADHWWQQVTLGRGSRDGIKVGSVVTSEGGIVGRITEVTPNTSRVLLISDPNSRVGATVSRSRNPGYIRGKLDNYVGMEFFEKVPDVQVGDPVSTSAHSQLFPPGLPIGVVASINLSKSPAPVAEIKLSAPVGHLEWVVVYPNEPLPELQQPQNSNSTNRSETNRSELTTPKLDRSRSETAQPGLNQPGDRADTPSEADTSSDNGSKNRPATAPVPSESQQR